MENKQIIDLDPKFDWSNVYKMNYCSLYNISFQEVNIEHKFLVDGVFKVIKFDNSLLRVVYREWRHENWFQLNTSTPENFNMFFTSLEKAKEWFEKNIEELGFELLESDKVEEVALLNIEASNNIIKVLNEKKTSE